MEDVKCKKLTATFQDEKLIFGEPKNLEIRFDENILIVIEQLGIRIITIISEKGESFKELYGFFTKIERLLMIFEGSFITLKELVFENLNEETTDHLKLYARDIMETRLSYYNSADFCGYTLNKLLDYEMVITPELFNKWQELLNELDIVHQMFLYATSDSKMPIDVKGAFLFELAEPLVEVVKANTHFYTSLKPGEKGTSLKMCIDALISKYGEDIFAEEIANNYDEFLQTIVNSRVRIMHIKRQQKGLYFNGSESILYTQKMIVLYRRVLFEIMGIDKGLYKEKMTSLIKSLDNWNDVQAKFFLKLK